MPKTSDFRFRNLVRQIHLALGLFSGLVVFVMAITGCCWVFQEEINSLVSPAPTVAPQSQAMLLPSQAHAISERVLPGRHIHGVLYGGRSKPVEVIVYEADPEFYQTVFLNPYTGEVLQIKDHLSGFFHFVLDGHMYLWLPKKIGTQIASWSTWVFVLMLISGLVLWWPKNNNNRKQRFQFIWKSSTKWKRKNYDLHTVLGFYASFLALIIALTGLVITFDWFRKFTYETLGGEKSVTFQLPVNTTKALATPAASRAAIDALLPKLMKEYPEALTMEFHSPPTDSSTIYVELAYKEGVYYSSDYRFYDQHTLEEVKTPSMYDAYENAGFPDTVIRMNYDVHVGAIGGLFGKILAFLASLTVASLPVSGVGIWLGRKKKKKATAKPDRKQIRANNNLMPESFVERR